MPRPKTELTKTGRPVAARLGETHYKEWVIQGGVNWLREVLDKAKQERENAEKM